MQDNVTRAAAPVGARRVLAVLRELALDHGAVSLDELAARIDASKPSIHRDLAILVEAGFVAQPARGHYSVGAEFVRLGQLAAARLSPVSIVQPALSALAEHFNETVHYAVLDGSSIVYQAKVDPPTGSVRLSSSIGGRNPAHLTAVGRVLLAEQLATRDDVDTWVAANVRAATTGSELGDELWTAIRMASATGYGVDDQENEFGVNCLAIPLHLDGTAVASGAVSISALAYRTPLAQLVDELPAINDILKHHLGSAVRDGSAPRRRIDAPADAREQRNVKEH